MTTLRGRTDGADSACHEGPARDGICLRGTVGCTIDHQLRRVQASSIAALQNTDGRPSTDFRGCVE